MDQIIDFALRHPFLVGGMIMALIAAIGWEIRLRSQAGVAVGAQEAVRLINQGGTVVDVRDAAAFAGGHIVDAVNLSADELAKNAEAKLKKKAKPVLLVCDTGAASGRLVKGLRAAGYENAWALDGGLGAWQRENLPVVASKSKG
jgi:rhodanese-related sulfurtransferase